MSIDEQVTRVVTIWTKRWKRSGKTKRCVYETKSHTDIHHRLREECNGQTWINPTKVKTHFVAGLPLDEPIVIGGVKVDLEGGN